MRHEYLMPRHKTNAGLEKIVQDLQKLGWVKIRFATLVRGYYQQLMQRPS